MDNYKKNTELEKKRNAINSLYSLNNPGIFQKNADMTIFEFLTIIVDTVNQLLKQLWKLSPEIKK